MSISIRPAQEGDLTSILAIYNHAVLTTTASWDYETRTPEKHVAWFEEHQKLGLPVLVAIDEAGTLVAWGSLSKFRDKIGYQHTVEHSVYVHKDHYRHGLGRMMVLALIDAACAMGKHVIIGGVASDNEASLRLHESLGFEKVATFKQVGYKFDRWLDLVFFQRILVG